MEDFLVECPRKSSVYKPVTTYESPGVYERDVGEMHRGGSLGSFYLRRPSIQAPWRRSVTDRVKTKTRTLFLNTRSSRNHIFFNNADTIYDRQKSSLYIRRTG